MTPLVALAVLASAAAVFALARGVSVALGSEHRTSRARLSAIEGVGTDASATPSSGRHRRRGNASQTTGTRSWLRRAGLRWEPRDFVTVTAVAAVLPALLGTVALGGFGPIPLAAGLVGALLPTLLVQRRVRSRANALNSQVVETLEVVASSLRSGFGFVQSLELAAQEQSEPIAAELRQCIREINLGSGTDDALERLVERTGDMELELAVNAVVIQRRVGGDLSEVLGNIAAMIRDRIRVRGEIHTLTAQARMSSWIVGLLPIALAGVMTMMQPDQMRILIDSPAGRMLVGGALLMEFVGFILVRRVASVEY